MNAPIRCAQDDCILPVYASLVWPGQGRITYCVVHAAKAVTIAFALGLSAESLDVQPSEPREEPTP
jgi:hypothetical protein